MNSNEEERKKKGMKNCTIIFQISTKLQNTDIEGEATQNGCRI